ncbi:MAG TPA: FAD-binding oxidoreductase [Candidatus Thermoplasmatota archaeon]|nr:FAD-binding oxidoreductase [Candidatus Thermoplasmatota archaeon]
MRKQRYHVVVIGAGAIGLSVAHHLAKAGITDVLVVDKDSLVKGATGRNGGGVRAQWTTKENILLAKESIREFKRFAAETGHNIFLRQGGYLFLTRSEEQLAGLRKATAFQNEHGVRTRLIPTSEAERLVPGLDTAGCVGATFNPDDAVLFPWPLVWGWKAAAERRGVEVAPFTAVTGLRVAGGRVTHVETNRGDVACDWVVNASGAWSRTVSSWVGLRLPIKPERHEILVTEPLKPFLDPMLVDLSTGYYLNQDMRGELVGGMGIHDEESMDWSSSLEFLRAFAKETVRLLPRLGTVKVLRQWAGSYDKTPDAKPIVGIAEAGPSNLVQASGFSGHGMMVSPMAGRLVAQLVAGQRPEMDLRPFALERFERGETVEDPMVIG